MSSTASFDWVYPVVGGMLGIAGLVLVVLALFRDPSRGRRRCPSCWYDMAGTPALKCPECGRTARHEGRMFRGRRRWKHAAGAVLLMMAGVVAAAVPAYRDRWQLLVPTTALALIAPAQDPSLGLGGSPFGRGNTVVPVLSGVPILGRAFRGAATGPPASVGEMMTDEFWLRLRAGKIAGWQGRLFVGRYFAAHPHDFSRYITLPRRWPVGVPLLIKTEDMLPASFTDGYITAHVRVLGGTRDVWAPAIDKVDAIATVRDSVDFEIELRHGRTVVYRTRVSMPCEIRPDDEHLLERVSGEDVDSRVKLALSPQLAWGPKNRGYFVTRDRTSAAKWNVLDMGISFDIELRDGETVLAKGKGAAEWNRPVWKDYEDIETSWEPGGLERAVAGRAGLTFRVVGNPGAARAQYLEWPWGKRPACWTGSFEAGVPE